MISQLGILPFGTTGPYSLPGKITVLAVLATAQNRVLVCWDVPPNVRDPKGTRSATNVGNYTITAIDPTIDTNNGPVVPLGEFVPSFDVAFWRAEVDEIDATQVHLWTDRNMEQGRLYNVVIDGPIDGALACEEFAGPIDWPLQAPWPPPVASDNPARVAELVLAPRPPRLFMHPQPHLADILSEVAVLARPRETSIHSCVAGIAGRAECCHQ